MHAFEYLRAGGLKQAADWLQQHPEARPLSGGMTLVPSLKHRLAQVSHLVDVARLGELRGIAQADRRAGRQRHRLSEGADGRAGQGECGPDEPDGQKRSDP